MNVTALLISHNGAQWLPAVLDGLAAQTHQPQAMLAVDTGSSDESVALLRQAGGWQVTDLSADSSYVDAVTLGANQATTEWVWLIHDDANPDPDALRALLTAAAANPDVGIFGPKLREWPSLRRLLELGVTISTTGRRETGLERGEYDQGQHDHAHEVLAVNTAGMLVRRDLLVTLGLDPQLRLFGADMDFGWRANRAGHRVMVVPEAVVFHAEAAQRGLRQAAVGHREQREAALYTLLANGSRGTLWRGLMLLVGSLLRALGFLLVRSPGEAAGEIRAVWATIGRPGRIRRARAWRREHADPTQESRVRELLAPRWLPVRHLMDSVTDFFAAFAGVLRDAAGASQASQANVPTGRRRVGDSLIDEESPADDEPSLLALLVRKPLLWLLLAGVGLAVVAARGGFDGPLWGGALAPAPDSIGWWWQAYWSGNHLLGTGSAAPAPAYVMPLMALAGLLGGHPSWAVAMIMLLAVPLAALSALWFLRRLVGSRAAAYWGAAGYGLLPVATGAVHDGRLGTVAGAIVLPWVATSALNLMVDDADRRWRAAWRTGLGGALLTAFVPVVWPVSIALILILAVSALTDRGSVLRQRDRWGPLAAAVLSVPVLLLPWVIGVGTRWSAWLVEAGRADAPTTPPTWWQAVAGRATADSGAPVWLMFGLLAVALLALARTDRQRGVRGALVVALVGALVALLLTVVRVHLPGLPEVRRAWPGFAMVLSYAGLLTAAVIGADGLRDWASKTGSLWRTVVSLASVAAGTLVVAGLAIWWVWTGLPGPMHHQAVRGVPTYMTELAYARDTSGILVLSGDARSGVSYRVLRHGPWRVGDDAIVALTPSNPEFTAVVAGLLSGKQNAAARNLADYGIAYVYVPAPARGVITGSLDASTALSRASAARAKDAAWRVQSQTTTVALSDAGQPWRRTLVMLQLLAIVVALVMAAPTRRRDR